MKLFIDESEENQIAINGSGFITLIISDLVSAKKIFLHMEAIKC